ncbi:hypothetical protein GCM10022207_84760 [Streptomyces lannensis]|uniref:Uncharacterized protein n=1 Tax=Streptomyces lannensis TaxID=766498 RepID=A0ABP7LMY0_9ACTN
MLNNQKYEHADNVCQVVIAFQTGKTSVKADLPNVATASARGAPASPDLRQVLPAAGGRCSWSGWPSQR